MYLILCIYSLNSHSLGLTCEYMIQNSDLFNHNDMNVFFKSDIQAILSLLV